MRAIVPEKNIPVILKPTNLDIYRDSNFEPQYVTAKQPVSAAIYLTTLDNQLVENPADCVLSTANRLGDNPSTLGYGISRISVSAVGIKNVIPNVNERNNTLTFFSTSSGLFHTVQLPVGYFTSSLTLMTAIITALNAVTGASGLTFSALAVVNKPDTYNLSSAGGNYFFDNTCDALVKGFQLYAFPTEQVATGIKSVGSMGLLYTGYFDVCSRTVTKYDKLSNQSSSKANNLIQRIYVSQVDFGEFYEIKHQSNPRPNFDFNSKEPINTIDFQIRDQYGDIIFLDDPDGNFNGFWWAIELLFEY